MNNLAAGAEETTIQLLTEHLSRLQDDRAALDRKIMEVRTHLQKLERQAQAVAGGRRKKGQNLQTIRELFEQQPDVCFTLQDISGRTGLPLSSIGTVLDKLKDRSIVDRVEDGQWRLVKPSAS
jgi:DNA-binding transcriptional ArsR family regulator